MLIPFADSLNHSEVSIAYAEFNPAKGPLQEELDCSDFFAPAEDPVEPVVVQRNEPGSRLSRYLASHGTLENVRSYDDIEVLLQGIDSSSDGDSAASFPASSASSGTSSEEEAEEDSAPDPPLDPSQFFVLGTRHSTVLPNAQVFNCYGRLNNTDLLTYYGFLLPRCFRDSCVVQLWSPVVSGRRGVPDETDIRTVVSEKHFKRTIFTLIKLKLGKLNEQLLTYCRRPLVAAYKAEHPEAESLFSCSPTLKEIEKEAALEAISLLEEIASHRYPSPAQDLAQLRSLPPGSKSSLAALYCVQQRRLIDNQVSVLRTLLQALSGTLGGFSAEELRFAEGSDGEVVQQAYGLRTFLRSMRANKQLWLPTTLPARLGQGYRFS